MRRAAGVQSAGEAGGDPAAGHAEPAQRGPRVGGPLEAQEVRRDQPGETARPYGATGAGGRGVMRGVCVCRSSCRATSTRRWCCCCWWARPWRCATRCCRRATCSRPSARTRCATPPRSATCSRSPPRAGGSCASCSRYVPTLAPAPPPPPPAAPRVTRAVVVVAVAGARHEVLVRVRAHVAAARAGHGRGGARPRAAPRAARARLARRARCVRFTLLPRLTILFLNDACPMFDTLELKRANRGPVSRWPTVLLPH